MQNKQLVERLRDVCGELELKTIECKAFQQRLVFEQDQAHKVIHSLESELKEMRHKNRYLEKKSKELSSNLSEMEERLVRSQAQVKAAETVKKLAISKQSSRASGDGKSERKGDSATVSMTTTAATANNANIGSTHSGRESKSRRAHQPKFSSERGTIESSVGTAQGDVDGSKASRQLTESNTVTLSHSSPTSNMHVISSEQQHQQQHQAQHRQLDANIPRSIDTPMSHSQHHLQQQNILSFSDQHPQDGAEKGGYSNGQSGGTDGQSRAIVVQPRESSSSATQHPQESIFIAPSYSIPVSTSHTTSLLQDSNSQILSFSATSHRRQPEIRETVVREIGTVWLAPIRREEEVVSTPILPQPQSTQTSPEKRESNISTATGIPQQQHQQQQQQQLHHQHPQQEQQHRSPVFLSQSGPLVRSQPSQPEYFSGQHLHTGPFSQSPPSVGGSVRLIQDASFDAARNSSYSRSPSPSMILSFPSNASAHSSSVAIAARPFISSGPPLGLLPQIPSRISGSAASSARGDSIIPAGEIVTAPHSTLEQAKVVMFS